MSRTDLSFEDVDKLIQRVDLKTLQRAAKSARTREISGAGAAATLGNVCVIWQAVKPILNLVMKLPLIPKKWKAVLKTLEDFLNAFCPG